jgi:4-aminobutyrate aminotransferase
MSATVLSIPDGVALMKGRHNLTSRVKRALSAERRYFTPSMDRLYPLFSTEVVGSRATDIDGKQYLDFSAGSGSQPLGGSHPEIVEVVVREVRRLGHISFPYMNEVTIALSEKLAKIAPGDFDKKVSFGTSGAEAVEGALKLVRQHTKRQLVISFLGAHSGHQTYGALSLCGHYAGQRSGFHPVVPGVIHIPYPYPYRNPFTNNPDECSKRCLEYLTGYILPTIAPPEDVGAIFIEAVQGPGGMVVPPDGFLRGIRSLCDKYGILLVDDEIVAGLGRTGKMFAIEHWNVVPDVVVVGKGLGAGVFPISADIARKEAMSWDPGTHSSTYFGHPLGSAIALKTIEIIERDKLAARAARLGVHVMERLEEMQQDHEIIGEVRGKGLLCGMELVRDRETKEPAPEETAKIAFRAFQRGLIMQYNGLKFNVFKFYPPLNIEQADLDAGLEILDKSIRDLEKNRIKIPPLPPAYLVQSMYK